MITVKKILVAAAVVSLAALAQAESVSMGVFSKRGSDVDYTLSGASATGVTLTYADNSDARTDSGAESLANVLFTKVGDKLTYSYTLESITNSVNQNFTFRSGFDFGSDACIHFITGYGTNIDARINYNLNGNPFSVGSTVGAADYAFATNKPSLTLSTGNTIDATLELTLVGMDEVAQGVFEYDYDLDVTISSLTETSTISRTVSNLPANTVASVYHLTNTDQVQISGETWSVANASLEFQPYVAPPQFTLGYVEIGSDGDSSTTNLSATGGTLKYGADTDGIYATGIETTIDGASGVAITNVGDKLVYTFKYKDLAVTPNINSPVPMRVGFDFGDTACLVHRTAVGTQAKLAFHSNTDGNPFTAGTELTVIADWSDYARRSIRFDDGNVIYATVSLTLQADHGDGTYDYLYEVEYIGSTGQNSESQTFTGVVGNTVASIFHVTDWSAMSVDGDEWTVSNAALVYEPYIPDLIGPQFLVATAQDGAVALDWEDSLNLGVSSYSIYRSEESGTNYVLVASGLTQSAYTNSGLANGITYYFVATATDSTPAESDFGNEVSATPGPGFLISYDLGLLDNETGGTLTTMMTYPATNTGGFVVMDPSDNDGRMDRIQYFTFNTGYGGAKVQGYTGDLFRETGNTGFAGSDVVDKGAGGATVFIKNSGTIYYAPLDTVFWIARENVDENSNGTAFNDMAYGFTITDNGDGIASDGDVLELIGIVYSTGTESVFGKTADQLTAALSAAPPAPYEIWALDYGLYDADAASDADPDLDGLKNLAEYAFGGNPTNAASQGVQPQLMDDGGLKYIYRIIDDTNMNHQVVTTTDLVNGGGSITVTLDGSGPDADPAYMSYTNSVDTSVSGAGFIHVEVNSN